MEEDQGSSGDHPPPESVTPDEAIKRLFGQGKIEPVWREIKRGEFMMELDERIEKGIKLLLEAQNNANAAQLAIFEAQAMQAKIRNLEMNDFKISYFVDQFGRLLIERASKDDIGFKKESEE